MCEIADPLTPEPYGRDPRRVAQKAEAHLAASGIADTACFGPECGYERENEVDAVRLRPHPAEFALYFDA